MSGNMFNNFKGTLEGDYHKQLDDSQIETFFWQVAKAVPEKAHEALELLTKYRNKVALVVARTFVEAAAEVT